VGLRYAASPFTIAVNAFTISSSENGSGVAKLLSTRDEYVHLADLPAYVERPRNVDLAWTDRNAWLRKSLLNIARMGKFSSDRTISEYARDIWGIKPAVIGNFAHALE
jgi:glucan phosphorylase